MTAESELAGLIARFAPEVHDRIVACRATMQAHFPDAVQLIHDNYSFLVIGFGATSRPSDSIFSLAAHAHGVNLCFLQRGPELPDPTSILRGSGTIARNVALTSPDDLDRHDVQALIDAELALASVPLDAADGAEVIIKSVSAMARLRRCAAHYVYGHGGVVGLRPRRPTDSATTSHADGRGLGLGGLEHAPLAQRFTARGRDRRHPAQRHRGHAVNLPLPEQAQHRHELGQQTGHRRARGRTSETWTGRLREP